MPCPRVPKPADGQRMKERGRTVLLVGTERVQQPRQDAPGEAQPASEAPPASGPHPVDWDNGQRHHGCGGQVKNASTTLPRRFCRKCKREWWWDGKWERV